MVTFAKTKAYRSNETMTYTVTTPKSWAATTRELDWEFKKWGVTEWDTNFPRGARLEGSNQTEEERKVILTYTKNGKPITLTMFAQKRAVDNLRVLYLVIQSLRMNELRQMDKIIESAYLQLAAPKAKKSAYEVLGIMPNSDLAIAEAVYRTMAQKYHPDSKPSGDVEKFKEINEAIEELRQLNKNV